MFRRCSQQTQPARSLSIHDPVYLGQDESGNPVSMSLPGRSVLFAGSPNAGKSAALQVCTAHTMLCRDVRRAFFFDAKQVEMGMWAPVATEFVGPDLEQANDVLRMLGAEMDGLYGQMLASGVRKIDRGDGYTLVVVDELAFYTSVYGEPKQQKEFARLLRDVVARGRAAGIIPLLATQRPSSDVVPTSLRDLVVYRAAFSVVNDASSDVILGDGWANAGYSAATIPASDDMAGVSLLRHESSVPIKLRWAYLRDPDLKAIITTAAALRKGGTFSGGDAAA